MTRWWLERWKDLTTSTVVIAFDKPSEKIEFQDRLSSPPLTLSEHNLSHTHPDPIGHAL
jgi:hypothetical protein